MSGEVFGPYRLEELLGRGGMGEVWRAVDTSHGNRMVAVKVLGSWLNGDAEFAQRFRRESALAAQLSSPHIVPIHGYGEIDGRLYIDMPLVDGTDLDALLERGGPLHPTRAVAIVEQVADALDTAHRAGMLHRDVKPSNVLVTGHPGRDHAYLIDFGIARAVDDTRHAATQHGGIGTLAYMAPERFEGRGDHRGDVYALGCVLYQTLTGRPPFSAESPEAFWMAHSRAPRPRPSAVRSEMPPGLDEVVATAMDPDAGRRYASAGQLAAAARAALTERPGNSAGRTDPPTAPAPPPVAARNRRGLAVAAGLVLVVGGCLYFGRDDAGQAVDSETSTESAVAGPTWTGEIRLAEGIDFTSGQPEQTDGYGGTLSYTDYQDRLGHGGRGSRLIAPWSDGTPPSYEQCASALQGSPYGFSEANDLPIADGAGYCVNDSDQVIVFVRLLGRDGEALRTSATVWQFGGSGGAPAPTGGTTLPPVAPAAPTWTGEVRLADGINFDRGAPRQVDPAFATIVYTDYQDRLSAGNFVRTAAPWGESALPSYEQCTTATQTNAYSNDESNDLPIAEGAGYCLVAEDVVVFLRLLGRDGGALRAEAAVWDARV